MKIAFHPEANEEMIESARFYEETDDGLGLRFLEAVEDTTAYSPVPVASSLVYGESRSYNSNSVSASSYSSSLR
jgi:hypothetical protein